VTSDFQKECLCEVANSDESCSGQTRSKIGGKLALRSGILFPSPEVMHRHRSDYLLHHKFEIRNIKQFRTVEKNAKRSALASLSLARALAVGLPRQDHV